MKHYLLPHSIIICAAAKLSQLSRLLCGLDDDVIMSSRNCSLEAPTLPNYQANIIRRNIYTTNFMVLTISNNEGAEICDFRVFNVHGALFENGRSPILLHCVVKDIL